MVTDADKAYIAALIDSLGKLTSRVVHRDELPVVSIQGKHAVLPWLAEVTGVRVMELEKNYTRHQCTEHCPDKHMPIESWTYRWQVTGARAAVVLSNVEPYLRLQAAGARRLIDMAQAVEFKPPTVQDMLDRGWEPIRWAVPA